MAKKKNPYDVARDTLWVAEDLVTVASDELYRLLNHGASGGLLTPAQSKRYSKGYIKAVKSLKKVVAAMSDDLE